MNAKQEKEKREQRNNHVDNIYKIGTLLLGAVSLCLGTAWVREKKAHEQDSSHLFATVSAQQQQILSLQSSNLAYIQMLSPQINGNSNKVNESQVSNIGNGKVASGAGASLIDNSGAAITSNTGKVFFRGNDNSINAGIVLIQLWKNDSKFSFPSNGTFTFPSNAPPAFKQQAQTDAFKNALRPFAALGTLQPEPVAGFAIMKPDKSSVPRPVSYSKLVECGALEADTRGQEALVSIAINRNDRMRPRWPMNSFRSGSWIQDETWRKLVQDSQNWISSYHEEMVQLGILSE